MIFATEAEAQENRMLALVAGNPLITQRVLATQINCRILSPSAGSGRWAWGQSTTALGPLPTFACSPGDVARAARRLESPLGHAHSNLFHRITSSR